MTFCIQLLCVTINEIFAGTCFSKNPENYCEKPQLFLNVRVSNELPKFFWVTLAQIPGWRQVNIIVRDGLIFVTSLGGHPKREGG